jgi:hypothetical protein
MKAIVICLIAILAGVLVYRSCRANDGLNVDPHARQEIEKAKHR